jgi:hypothetical protein
LITSQICVRGVASSPHQGTWHRCCPVLHASKCTRRIGAMPTLRAGAGCHRARLPPAPREDRAQQRLQLAPQSRRAQCLFCLRLARILHRLHRHRGLGQVRQVCAQRLVRLHQGCAGARVSARAEYAPPRAHAAVPPRRTVLRGRERPALIRRHQRRVLIAGDAQRLRHREPSLT